MLTKQCKFKTDRYFSSHELVRFRELQASTGTVISGSTALQFFERTVYSESDLDLYVEHQHCRPMASWLQCIGYEYIPRQGMNFKTLEETIMNVQNKGSDNQPMLTDAFTDREYFDSVLLMDFQKTNPLRKIQLVTTKGPVLSMILEFHSSESLLVTLDIVVN
jgi:hypothetical protein